MPIYEFAQSGIIALTPATFSSVNIRERRDLQRLLRENVEVIAPDTLVIAEEFGEWEDSRRRVDLLGVDKEANLVVIELKRTEDGGHMELQAIRYASMISTMTFERTVEVFGQYLKTINKADLDPRTIILDFLGWEEADEDRFGQDVRIILSSAEFSKEVTSSVLWLVDHGIDIRCVRLKPYRLDDRVLVDVQQIIPLPEVVEFQVQIREKVRKEREARTGGMDLTRYDIRIDGEQYTAMWKRNAIYQVCRYLCANSISPEDIAKNFKGRQNRVWFFVEGTIEAAEFATLAAQKASLGGGNFNANRWFCEDKELIQRQWKDIRLFESMGR